MGHLEGNFSPSYIWDARFLKVNIKFCSFATEMLLPDLQNTLQNHLSYIACSSSCSATCSTVNTVPVLLHTYISSDLYPSFLRTRLCESTHAFKVSLDNSFDAFNAAWRIQHLLDKTPKAHSTHLRARHKRLIEYSLFFGKVMSCRGPYKVFWKGKCFIADKY